jgi:hypothetical protein
MPKPKYKRNQDIWNMRYRQGWSYSRIGKAFGISKQAAYRIVERVDHYKESRA